MVLYYKTLSAMSHSRSQSCASGLLPIPETARLTTEGSGGLRGNAGHARSRSSGYFDLPGLGATARPSAWNSGPRRHASSDHSTPNTQHFVLPPEGFATRPDARGTVYAQIAESSADLVSGRNEYDTLQNLINVWAATVDGMKSVILPVGSTAGEFLVDRVRHFLQYHDKDFVLNDTLNQMSILLRDMSAAALGSQGTLPSDQSISTALKELRQIVSVNEDLVRDRDTLILTASDWRNESQHLSKENQRLAGIISELETKMTLSTAQTSA
jgi:hypothetical protein